MNSNLLSERINKYQNLDKYELIKSKDLELIECFIKNKKIELDEDFYLFCAQTNNLEFIKKIEEKYGFQQIDIDDEIIDQCFSFIVCKWLFDNNYIKPFNKISKEIFILELINLISYENDEKNILVFDTMFPNFNIKNYFYVFNTYMDVFDEYYHYNVYYIFEHAIKNKNINMINWLFSKGLKIKTGNVLQAIKMDDFYIFKIIFDDFEYEYDRRYINEKYKRMAKNNISSVLNNNDDIFKFIIEAQYNIHMINYICKNENSNNIYNIIINASKYNEYVYNALQEYLIKDIINHIILKY